MHCYDKPQPDGSTLPSLDGVVFKGPIDVVRWAERDPTIGWSTWPVAWHLDPHGTPRGFTIGSSCDSIRTWALDARPLRRSRLECDCPDRWLIVESRPRWRNNGSTVDERDALAYFNLRDEAVRFGVQIVDAMIFDDDGHWWSMHELTTGSTVWAV